MNDLFEDAFNAIARCAADSMEVGVRLQKTLQDMAEFGPDYLKQSAIQQSRLALEYAEKFIKSESDLQRIRKTAQFSESTGQ